METELNELRKTYPWPAECPDVKPEPDLGWFTPDTQIMVRRHITEKTKLIIELGSFLGTSVRAMLGWSDIAHVVCIDHFKGSSEHRGLPNIVPFLRHDLMWRTFVCNMWSYRERCTVLRQDTISGMQAVANHGLVPDLVYVDASHETKDVLADCRTAHGLWRDAQIVGDDWSLPTVRAAVQHFIAESGLEMFLNDQPIDKPRPIGWGLREKTQ